jgi:hypothetical protein
MADSMFAHFFATDYSQTEIYPGNISSFAWIIQNNLNDISSLISAVRTTLTSYFTRYFQSVTVEVNQKDELDDPSKVGLTIYIGFTDRQGKTYNLARLVRDIGSKTSSIVKINNYGI